MFTQSCFIRKNTPGLRKKLEDLGYKKSKFGSDLNNSIATTTSNDKPSYTCIREQSFEDTNPHTTWGFKFRIDCGDNEELFLALAALRDDTDENQWFICDIDVYKDISKGEWFKSTDISGGKRVGIQIDPMYCHKATIEEIIEHFKTK